MIPRWYHHGQDRPKRQPHHSFPWWTFQRQWKVGLWTVTLLPVFVAFATWRFYQSGDDYSTVVLLRLGYDGIFSNMTTFASALQNTTTDHLLQPLSSSSSSSSFVSHQDIDHDQDINSTLFKGKKLRLVIVGDSLSRYMYLSLVYYVKHGGQWVPPVHELLEKVKDSEPEAWNAWLALTQRELEYEVCDCYRYWKHPFKWNKHCENRYYHWNGHAIAFITKFGGNPFHGHVPGTHVFANITTATFGINQTKRSYDWVYPTWDGLIENYIAQWNPKPTLLLFNQGHWKGHELRDTKVLKALRRALKKHGIRGIYRTTTFRQDERVVVDGKDCGGAVQEASLAAFRNKDTRAHDGLVCQYFECFNVSWTAGIPTTEYVDPVHFKASTTNRMNEQFLQEFVIG